MSTGKVLLGVMTGLAIGATLGILFAPDKGSETRKKIREKGDEHADELGEKFNELVDSTKEKFKTVKEETASVAGNRKYRAEGTPASDGAI